MGGCAPGQPVAAENVPPSFLVLAEPGIVTGGTWRFLVYWHGVPLFDHALGWPQWDWIPRFVQLLALHATDIFSWGVFWAVVLGVMLRPSTNSAVRASRVMLSFLFLFTAAALLGGPERVRVFAENGTLLNRLLLQLWPCAAFLVIEGAQ